MLSAYQDGAGMLVDKRGKSRPGWRDFERTIAAVLDAHSSESKAIFDVIVQDPEAPGVYCGLSCKMRRALSDLRRTGRVTIELSNSSGKFWDALAGSGINTSNYRDKPLEVGSALVNLVKDWHQVVSQERGGLFDLSRSSYLVLSWSTAGFYQLHQFRLELPDPRKLRWHFPQRVVRETSNPGRRLRGDDDQGTLFEWYGESGGQLKYYPLAAGAVWQSDQFQLEPLPDAEYGIRAKAAAYFPVLWAAAND